MSLPDFSERDQVTWRELHRLERRRKLRLLFWRDWFADFEKDDTYDESDN